MRICEDAATLLTVIGKTGKKLVERDALPDTRRGLRQVCNNGGIRPEAGLHFGITGQCFREHIYILTGNFILP